MDRTLRIAVAAFVSALYVLPLSANAAVLNTMDEQADDLALISANPVNDSILGESRGSWSPDFLSLSNASQNANSSGNVVNGGVTGSNQISTGSFSNTQGLVNVIQNSGNNVVIQSSTIVNMTMINQ